MDETLFTWIGKCVKICWKCSPLGWATSYGLHNWLDESVWHVGLVATTRDITTNPYIGDGQIKLDQFMVKVLPTWTLKKRKKSLESCWKFSPLESLQGSWIVCNGFQPPNIDFRYPNQLIRETCCRLHHGWEEVGWRAVTVTTIWTVLRDITGMLQMDKSNQTRLWIKKMLST